MIALGIRIITEFFRKMHTSNLSYRILSSQETKPEKKEKNNKQTQL